MVNFGNMTYNLDFIESFGTRELKQNKVEIIPIEAEFNKDFFFSMIQSEIGWENTHLMSLDMEIWEEYK